VRNMHLNKPLIGLCAALLLGGFIAGNKTAAPVYLTPEADVLVLPESTPMTNTKVATDYVRLLDGRKAVIPNKANGLRYFVRLDTWGDGTASAALEIVPTATPKAASKENE
jgi:hypothetical protein